MDAGLFWIGAGLAFLGYFIGDGLKNLKNPKVNYSAQPTLIDERDLHLYLGLTKEETKELLSKYPDAPKVVLKGTTYYPYQRFLEWLTSNDIY
ncbi:hypothetical protein SAMN05880501_11482 [Ureibacillus xyleni]|uniref:DNA-binding protein n=1 Tax=Ureibacillus xyleni TaxID=614648 RepID=A0A285TJV0_9BACL|nr:DNA-binding protein [Ureibacillus xyleni]SOC22719.1 hypothetical protein SAMN05880501_11482 [Ureibacillus xyleni]